MINFPNSPLLNQIFNSGNNSWIWNGYAWDILDVKNRIKRGEVVGSYIYCGTAPRFLSNSLTSETDEVWTIVRLETNTAGEVVGETVAQPAGQVNWVDFQLHMYS